MLMFRDFVPKQLEKQGLFSTGLYESFEGAVQAASKWLATEKVRPMQLETVVLPNLWNEGGSTDPSIMMGHPGSGWNQFLRVWFDDGRDTEAHPFR
ncbi:MAG: hypothetical protein IT370_08820 [Deltaproteobacteria bacterium]|nr:hypothetical protein [Deltaproteobacteria bacterium]